MGFSDSAFRARECDGLTTRGCLILVVEQLAIGPRRFRVVVLDWFSRKHVHVVRSTYAAELHALLDGVNQGVLLALAFTEIVEGVMSAAKLAELQTSGKFRLEWNVRRM